VLTEVVPFVPSVAETNVASFPSISVSFASTEISTGVSSSVVAVSATVTVASFTSVTVKLTFAAFEVAPSSS